MSIFKKNPDKMAKRIMGVMDMMGFGANDIKMMILDSLPSVLDYLRKTMEDKHPLEDTESDYAYMFMQGSEKSETGENIPTIFVMPVTLGNDGQIARKLNIINLRQLVESIDAEALVNEAMSKKKEE